MDTKNKVLIDNFSFSSMKLLMSNPLAFKKRYILKIYEGEQTSPAAVVGSAGHKAIETYFRMGGDEEKAIEEGLKLIAEKSDFEIAFGKTGSREKMNKDFIKGIGHVFSSKIFRALKIEQVHGIEQKITAFINLDGKEMAIPAKSHTDLIYLNDEGEVDVHDWKFKGSGGYTDTGEYNWPYIMQAMFNYHTVHAWIQEKSKEFPELAGKKPKRMIFWEIKLSENKNGDSQIQQYTIEYEKYPEYFELFAKLYNDCTRLLMNAELFLPNPSDMFDGDQSMLWYMQGLISSDRENIIVDHKQTVEKFVEKVYTASAHDKIENKAITEEEKIRLKMQEFGMPLEMKDTHTGANIILYTAKVARGVRMSSLGTHGPDIALVLKARSVRVLAPILGTDMVGFEVPNPDRYALTLSDDSWMKKGTLRLPIGANVYGQTIWKDLSNMPHLLVAGSTNSGKSVMLGVLIRSLVAQNEPHELGLILIDTKRVELIEFASLPHLIVPTIIEGAKGAQALRWLVDEMEVRYKELEQNGVKNISEYIEAGFHMKPMVVVVDEFADFILSDWPEEIPDPERSIVRLAQMSRAVGIHLIIATQRPSVDVISGLIKANFPTRIAFMTTSQTDSKIILDQPGAEMLNGAGDLLFLDPHKSSVERLQGYLK